MNPYSETLLSILSACNPSDTDLVQRAKIEKIMASKAYKELKNRQSFADEFQKHFSEDKLRSYTSQQLKQVQTVLPLIPNILSDINISIRNGIGYKLKPEDKPDFMNYNQLQKLKRKLEADSGKNYSNIPAEQSMHIFDQDIIRDAKSLFGLVSVDCTDWETALDQVSNKKYFCIPRDEIERLQKEQDAQCVAWDAQMDSIKANNRWKRVRKLAIGLLAMLFPAIIGACTGLIDIAGILTCTFIILILSIIYWILG